MKFLLLSIFILMFAAGLNAQEREAFDNFSADEVMGVIHQNGNVFVIMEDTVLTFNENALTNSISIDSLNFYIYPDFERVNIDFWIFPFYGIYRDHLRNIQYRTRTETRLR